MTPCLVDGTLGTWSASTACARPITNSAFILRLTRELRNDGRPERRVLIDPADGGRTPPVGELDTNSDWWWTLSVAR